MQFLSIAPARRAAHAARSAGIASAAAAAMLLSLVVVSPVAQAAAPAPVIDSVATVTGTTGDVVFAWLSVAGATSYKVEMSTSSTFSVTAFYTATTASLRATPTAAIPNGTWHWRVAAIDASGQSDWTVGTPFVRDPVPGPALIGPGVDSVVAVNYPTTPLLSWSPVPYALSYTVEWSLDPAFSGASTATTAATSYTITTLLARGSTWYWRVRATLNTTPLTTAWSTAAGFTTSWTAAAPTLLLPTHDPSATTPVSDVQLSWSAVSGATKYKVYISTDPSFPSDPNTTTVTVMSTKYSPARSLANAGYYWKVTALDPAASEGPASATRQFTRSWGESSLATMDVGEELAAPESLLPASGTSITRDDFELSWSAVPRASVYEVWLTTETSNFFSNSASSLKCYTPHTRLTSYDAFAALAAGSWIKLNPTLGCFGGLTAGGPYRWRVRALDLSASDVASHNYTTDVDAMTGVIRSEWSHRGSINSAPAITVTADHPTADVGVQDPTLTSPADLANSTDTPELIWTPTDGATAGYYVQIALDGSFTNIVGHFHTHSARLQLSGGLLDNSTGQAYYWRVGGCTSFTNLTTKSCGTPDPALFSRRFRKTGLAPAGLAATQTGDAMTFTWAEHLLTSPIGGGTRGYELQIATDSLFSSLVSGFSGLKVDQPFLTTSADLLPDGTYYVQVHAIDGVVADLPWSAGVQFTKTSTRATRDVAASGATAPALSWSSVAGTASYNVQIYNGNNLSASGSQVLLQNAVVNTAFVPTAVFAPGTYSWRVRRVDAAGNVLPWAFEANDAGIPTFTVGLSAVSLSSPADGAALIPAERRFTWAPSSGAVKYRVQTSTSSSFATIFETVDTGQSTLAPTLLTYVAGTTYYWRVLPLNASNAILNTPSSGRSFTVQTVPGTTTATAAATGTTVTFAWSTASNGGSAITNYALRYRVFGTSTWTEVAPAADVNSLALSDMAQSTKYEGQVAAVNAIGTGAYSTLVSATTATVPGTPTALRATATATTLVVSWTAPATGGSAITGYIVRYGPAGGGTTIVEVTGTSATLSGLANATSYTIDVAARNIVGTGTYASALSASTLAPPVVTPTPTPTTAPTTPVPAPVVTNPAPTVTIKAPIANAPVTTAFTATFSEAVTGVAATSMKLTMNGSTTAVPAAVTLSIDKKVATLKPALPLQPGRTYTVSLSAAIKDVAGAALVATSWSTRTSLTIDSASPALSEIWDRDVSAAASGGSFVATATAGAKAVITFSGTSAQLLAATGPDAGTATVKLDALAPVTVNLYRPTAGHKTVVFNKTGLRAGAHTITITATGAKTAASKGTWIRLDALKVGASLIQDNHATWKTAFRRVTALAASSGSYDIERQVALGDNGTKATYQAVFYGTGVTAFFAKTASSGRADVFIDGRKVTTIDLYSATAKYKVAAFTRALTAGQHTIAITMTGAKAPASKGTDVALDHLVIN